jgi:hypothetical protein
MMTSRSLICLLENQNGGKLQKVIKRHEENYEHTILDYLLFYKLLFYIFFSNM